MNTENMDNENAALIEAMNELGAVETIDIGKGVEVLSVPKGRSVASVKAFLDEYLPAPERKKGPATFTTLDSFIAHANRTKDADSAIFADDRPDAPALVAVYNYNGKAGDPRFGDHRARYAFPLSDEWQAWKRADGQKLSMADFAEFLEDRIIDVILPETGMDSIKEFAVNLGFTLASPQQLMTLSRGLKVNVDTKVTNAQTIGSGESQFVFEEQHKDTAGAPLRVPGGFAIQIPVFRGGAAYHVPVRLRYRIVGGQILWFLALHRTDVIFRDAIEEAAKKAADDTALPVFFGVPEGK